MRYQLILLLLGFQFISCSQKNNEPLSETHKYTNELIHESSPYLLQHAHNPVDWRPWNKETLQLAKEQNKPMIISIGYAACHWCHVMEHESFEDIEVAEIMNTHFIPVKVDREERPDVDDIYMTACNIVSGRGGWPLNAIALPDGRPFFAGTYYPKKQWVNILEQVIEMQERNPDRLLEAANGITEGIKKSDVIEVNKDATFEVEGFNEALKSLLDNIDYVHGGNDRAPRFPMPNNFELIQKYYWLSNDERALEAINVTLTEMGRGGIYDQIGGGFARYSVDGVWKVPHFEKMLYDNGQLLGLYAEGYKLTKDEYYKEIAEEIYEFSIRDLRDETNGFYSSLDADSEGVEGKFYVWDEGEIDSLLREKATIYKRYYSVTPNGNWEHSNILHITKPPTKIAKGLDMEVKSLHAIIKECDQILFETRKQRIHPGLDDKILCSWNALQINGLLQCYEAFNDEKYYKAATETLQFILDNMLKDGNLLHRNFKNGKSSISGFLDDYALTIKALLKCYQTDFNETWLLKAEQLMEYTLQHFSSEENQLFYYTSDLDDPLIVRKLEYSDNVIPASNSIMALNLFELGNVLYKTAWIERSETMLKAMHPNLMEARATGFYSNWHQMYLNMLQAPYEVAIVGPDAENLRKEFSQNYLGNTIILGSKGESDLPLLESKYQEGETFIYVCQNKSCKFPVQTIEEALALIRPTLE